MLKEIIIALLFLIIGLAIGIILSKIFHFGLLELLDFSKNIALWGWNSLIGLISGLKGG